MKGTLFKQDQGFEYCKWKEIIILEGLSLIGSDYLNLTYWFQILDNHLQICKKNIVLSITQIDHDPCNDEACAVDNYA